MSSRPTVEGQSSGAGVQNYVDSLNEQAITAAYRVHAKSCGTLSSDIWPAKQGADEAAMERDYQIVAAQWDWLHPSSELSAWDAADAWVHEFIDDILENEPASES